MIFGSVPLDPETLLTAYAQGVFPMADRDGVIRWYTADPRGVFPLDAFHVPQSLRGLVDRPAEQGGFDIRINHNFADAMRACMEQRSHSTWINEPLIAAYNKLHAMRFAHSVEAWRNGELAGGLYGVS